MKERKEDTLAGSAEQGKILDDRTEGGGSSETPMRCGPPRAILEQAQLSVTNSPWYLAVPNALAAKTLIFISHL